MLERHLCNLHNEVFEAAESRINTECSLTIREGVSNIKKPDWFTWKVPSLYVRVYRMAYRDYKKKFSSLTIREGVSVEPLTLEVFTTFPHYT